MMRSIVLLTVLFLFVAGFATQVMAEERVVCIGDCESLYTNITEDGKLEFEWVVRPFNDLFTIGFHGEMTYSIFDQSEKMDDCLVASIVYFSISYSDGSESILKIPGDLFTGADTTLEDGLVFVSNMDESWYKMCQVDKKVHEIVFGEDENGFPRGFVFDPMLNYPSQPVCDPNGVPPFVPEDKDLNNVPVQCDKNGGPPQVPKDEDLINVPVQCDPNGGPPPVPEDKDLINIPVQCDPNGGPPPVPEDKDLICP